MIDAPIVPRKDCSLHMTLEHLVPVVLGGTHDLWNLALACFQCNNARGDSPFEFTPPWSSWGAKHAN
jgi:5-methylcytosine-specific restriction endonuclease McrA